MDEKEYPIVEIQWEDAVFVLDPGDFDVVVDCKTVGYLVAANPSYYEVAMEFDALGKPSGLERIPTGIVKKVTYIGEDA